MNKKYAPVIGNVVATERPHVAGAERHPGWHALRKIAARITTPLLPDDYLHLANPLWSAREIRGLDDAKQVAGQLEKLSVRLSTRAGASGRLFGSVSPADIADAVRAAGGPDIDRRRIEITNPIKTVGSHQVRVRLHPDVAAAVDVEIVAS